MMWVLLLALPAAAHENAALEPHDLWQAWSLDPWIVGLLAASGLLYFVGQRRAAGVRPYERTVFWIGWVCLLLALISPLHPLGEVLFSAHMVQHEVMMLAAAPLLILGRPMIAFLWALPMTLRRWAGATAKARSVQAAWSFLTDPFHATWIHGLALWIGHAPALFNATLRSDAIHAGQHAMFLGSALLFWWAIIRRAKAQAGLAVLYLFATMVHSGVLGALLVISNRPWYPRYVETTAPWGLSPLEDQQLGGLIMWVPASFVFLIAGLVFFYCWMQDPSRTEAQFSKSLV
jgi:putative membrane protein